MKGKLIPIVLLVFLSVNLFAQREIDEDSPLSFKDRGYAGVGLGGLSIGNGYFSVGGGVLGGLMLTRNLSTGVGFEYQYTSYSYQKLKNHVYGGYPFVRYNIKNFFIQFDYDLFWLKANIPTASAEATQERFFGGLGFFGAGRGRVQSNFLISYDFLYTSASLFSSPLNTRLFFTF
jgi:hypothetical protein